MVPTPPRQTRRQLYVYTDSGAEEGPMRGSNRKATQHGGRCPQGTRTCAWSAMRPPSPQKRRGPRHCLRQTTPHICGVLALKLLGADMHP
eukprot:13632488-Alexandrium_andersonii.AAC.1